MTVDEAMNYRWAGQAAEQAVLVLQAEVRRLRASEQELARLRFAAMALVDKWRALAEELVKAEEEHVADMAEDAADGLEGALKSEV